MSNLSRIWLTNPHEWKLLFRSILLVKQANDNAIPMKASSIGIIGVIGICFCKISAIFQFMRNPPPEIYLGYLAWFHILSTYRPLVLTGCPPNTGLELRTLEIVHTLPYLTTLVHNLTIHYYRIRTYESLPSLPKKDTKLFATNQTTYPYGIKCELTISLTSVRNNLYSVFRLWV